MQSEISRELYEEKSLWQVILNNGLSFFETQEDSFSQLKEYCKTNKVYISEIYLSFRSHREQVFSSSDEDGLFFVKSAKSFFGSDRTEHRYIFGKIYQDDILADVWITPEIILDRSEQKKVKDYKDKCFIWKENT